MPEAGRPLDRLLQAVPCPALRTSALPAGAFRPAIPADEGGPGLQLCHGFSVPTQDRGLKGEREAVTASLSVKLRWLRYHLILNAGGGDRETVSGLGELGHGPYMQLVTVTVD